MQLYDKDLLSVQEVRELVRRAKAAQRQLMEAPETIDAILRAIAEAGVRNAARLGRMAREETEFGVAEHKMVKNIFASKGVYEHIRDVKVLGVLETDEAAGYRTVGVPLGVIAGLIPSTNPTSTVFYKALIALKAGNAIVFSPHPNARECITAAVGVIRGAILEAGGNEDLVGVITMPTIQATDVLMSHRDVSLILATGGAAMVRAAYSSGTPALGVGPGNGPAFIERSADVAAAVREIVASKTFDNGTICASEQSVIVEHDMREAVQKEMERQGCYFLDDAQREQLGRFILRGNGTMNPMIVGRDVQTIARLAGLDIPAGTRILVAEETGVGPGHPYANEKLCPILGFFVEADYKQVCDRVVQVLTYEGMGHTFCIHSDNQAIVDYFVSRVPVSRVIVNGGGSMGGIGATTGLAPALTLGCGAAGGSATSDNIGPLNLIDRKRVACARQSTGAVIREAERLSAGVPSTVQPPRISEAGVEAIVLKVMERLMQAEA